MIRLSFWVGLALTVLTGFFNPGIIGIDDYNNGFAVMIPAQNPLPPAALYSGIFPFIPKLLLRGLAHTIYLLGVTDPFWQLGGALAILGAFVYLVLFSAGRKLFEGRERESRAAAFFVAFYFALPLFSTRPMNETLCMPFLTLSGVWTALYARSGAWRWLVAALAALAAASLMRFQAGVCGLAILFLVVHRRKWHEWVVFAVAAVAVFAVSGSPDYYARGEFHGQLRDYIDYNLSFSGAHFGRMPFYTFFALALGLSLPPTFLSRYRGFEWRRAYQPLFAPLLFVGIFLVAHSLSPHKEDRFFIPILPLFLFCLVPLAAHLWVHGAAWRRYWFLAMNGLLLVLACTNIAQNNLTGLARWVEANPQVTGVDSVDRALVFTPQAFLTRPVQWSTDQTSDHYANADCARVAVVRSDTQLGKRWETAFREVGRFSPGWLEQILVKTNPKNARRGPLVAFLPAHCPVDSLPASR
jgi:hypothetical protein